MRAIVRGTLGRAGLLPLAWRTRRRLRAARRIHVANLQARLHAERAPDGLPVPPPRLRYIVGGSTDVTRFLAGGERLARMIEDTLARNGIQLERLGAILDFGAGCGRIARHWHALEAVEVHGTDYNAELIDWCRANLPFGRFETNELAPPLPCPDGRFDFVYAYSVFTHLPEELQRAWFAELRRVLRPRGHLLVTTHGDAFAERRLEAAALERYRRGELVVRMEEVAGTNTCAAFHPRGYVSDEIGGFDIVELVPGAGPGSGKAGAVPQDVYLLRASD